MEIHENLNNIYLGQPLNFQENEKHEFKEFCLEKYTSTTSYTEEEIINLIKNNIFNPKLNKLIKTNLFCYLEKYIPKYYCSFCNSKLKSKLYIGVNDLGEITGIPLFDIKKKDIENYIDKYILKKINGSNINISDFKIDIIKLKKDKSMVYDISNKLLDDYIFNKKNREKMFNKYNKDYKEWHTELQIKSGKLIRILYDIKEKKDFINYIKDNNGPQCVLDYVINNKKFNIPRGENMKNRKQNKNDYIYWLTQFKDKQQKDMVDLKPIKPYYKMSIDPYIILDKLTDLRYNYIDNEQINYFMIVIEINGLNKNSPLYFYQKNKLIYRKRIGNICL